MPYYRHPKSAEEHTIPNHPAFASMAEARKDIDPKTEIVTFIASDDENETWIQRERDRFYEGTYLPVPWLEDCGVYWYRSYDRSPLLLLYPHLSVKSPGLIAYTQSPEHGYLDRQTPIKPGRFLEQFHKDDYTAEQIADFIARCGPDSTGFKLATSEKDIVALYSIKNNSAIQSCMQSKRSPEYSWQRPFERGYRPHPCAVYGDSDLAVAYLGEIPHNVLSRCVVWPRRKLWSRIYGNQAKMRHALTLAGYTQGWPEGARVRALHNGQDIIMPYIDGIDDADYDSEDRNWIILGDGDIGTQHTTGYGSSRDDESDDDDDDGENDDLDRECEHCGGAYSSGSQGSGYLNERWCDDCLDRREHCAHCNQDSWRHHETVNNVQWCDNCVDAATSHCPADVQTLGVNTRVLRTCDESWLECTLTDLEQSSRAARHVSHLCPKHSADVQQCLHCQTIFDALDTACSVCGLAVRCTQTLDLLVFAVEPLPIGADGSLWWTENPHQRIVCLGTYWVKWAGGVTQYTCAPFTDFSKSHYNTLDNCSDFVRVPDPRMVSR